MADYRRRVEGKRRGCFERKGRKRRMPDEIHATVDGPQAPIANAPLNLTPTDTATQQLPAANSPMLEVGKCSNDRVNRSKPGFATHTV